MCSVPLPRFANLLALRTLMDNYDFIMNPFAISLRPNPADTLWVLWIKVFNIMGGMYTFPAFLSLSAGRCHVILLACSIPLLLWTPISSSLSKTFTLTKTQTVRNVTPAISSKSKNLGYDRYITGYAAPICFRIASDEICHYLFWW